MTENKKITRRDAIKFLGAVTGATVLANLPSKWNTPSIARGVLPAHAQTSTCYALQLEVLTAVGGNTGAGPTGIGGPDPDEFFGGGGAGATLGWYCQTGCLQFFVRLLSATSASIQVTTIASSFTLNLDAGTPYQEVLVDLGTGAYALNGIGSAGSCSWPVVIPIAPLQSQGNNWFNN